MIFKEWPLRARAELLWQLARRDVVGRYRGASLGVVWALITPLLQVLLYTFLFAYVFKSRWAGNDSPSFYGVVIFSGFIVHGFLTDVMSRSVSCIVSQSGLVKKVVFPLSVLPVVVVASGLFHALLSSVALSMVLIFLGLTPGITSVALPLILAPLFVFCLGLSWFLAALGVYLRDMSQLMSLIVSSLLFTAPVLYPRDVLPSWLQPWLLFNPLTFVVEEFRAVLFFGTWPDWGGLFIYSTVSMLVAWLGWLSFVKTSKGFADVL
jgi:lipopolysaccharide transport system permease protein